MLCRKQNRMPCVFALLFMAGHLLSTFASAALPDRIPEGCGQPPKNIPCYDRPPMIVPPEEGFLAGPLHQPNMRIPQLSVDGHDFFVLPATPATTTWGYFDSSVRPALTIKSGDTVAVETLPGGGGNVAPGITIEALEYINAAVQGRGPHTMTGPIAVAGAMPPSKDSKGDVLAIHINKIRMRSYATNNSGDFAGLFSEYGQGGPYQSPVFPHFVSHFVDSYYLDNDKMEAVFETHPRIVVPLKPFPGVLAVARSMEEERLAYTGNNPADPKALMGWCVENPPAPLGGPGCNTKQPGNFGGNLDLPAMTVGSTTYLPVWQKGGLIWTGDSHAAQGNGEIDLDALETAFPELNITVDVIHRDGHPEFGDQPIVETPTSWVTLGYAVSLNEALNKLMAETTRFIAAKYGLSKEAAEARMFNLWDCPISEVVDEVLGTYCMIPKNAKSPRSRDLPKKDTSSHWVSYASDPADLMGAMKKAAYASVQQMAREIGISEAKAYKLATFVQDCRIERPKSLNPEAYGVSCMVPKSIYRRH